jgi:hypothetical protein
MALAACEPGSVGDGAGAVPGGEYTLQVFSADGGRIYVVSRSNGRETAARAAAGESVILDADEAHGLIAQRPLAAPPEADVSVRAPGFALSIADDDAAGGDNARIELNVGGKGVFIDAADTGPARRALVRIVGADADAARNFITEARGLSVTTKEEMLKDLGLRP